ncbi:MAG: hypothetical protein KGZ59_08410 [Chitinophagaceae bacterium]|nr:hypothetical protein [Chitinophagaceae bacterium]
MKKLIFLSFIGVSFLTTSFCQNEKYMAAMGSTLQQFGAAKTVEEMNAVAAKFERIGEAEKTQWLPYYYAALTKAQMAFDAKDKDKVADEATALINKAYELDKNNSEIFCVKTMICYAKMMVDPMSRWMQYGAEATANLDEAKKYDASNPRPYYLEATSLKNTPEQFGGGCASAKPIAEKAAKLLLEFKPASPLHPNWGKESIDALLNSCK